MLVIGGNGGSVDKIGTHIQIFGENDLCFILFLFEHSLVLESFQMQDQYLRSLINFKDLLCQFVFSAIRAVPFVALLEFFLL